MATPSYYGGIGRPMWMGNQPAGAFTGGYPWLGNSPTYQFGVSEAMRSRMTGPWGQPMTNVPGQGPSLNVPYQAPPTGYPTTDPNFMRRWMEQFPSETGIVRATTSGGGAAPYTFPQLSYPTPGTNVTAGPVAGSATGWTPEYGGIPSVANPLLGQAGATLGNLYNLPAIQGLASGVNPFQQSQLLANYESAFPGFGARMSEGSEGIRSNLAGEVSDATRRQIAIGAAERGAWGGQLGATPMTNEMLLAGLGRTSEGYQQLGQQQLNQRIAATPVVQPYDVTRDLVTGPQLTEAANLANLYAAAPVPSAQAAEETRRSQEAMAQGAMFSDWLSGRAYDRTSEQARLDREQALRMLGYGSGISEIQQRNAFERQMAMLNAQLDPYKNLRYTLPMLPRYNQPAMSFPMGEDMYASGNRPLSQAEQMRLNDAINSELYNRWYMPQGRWITQQPSNPPYPGTMTPDRMYRGAGYDWASGPDVTMYS